MDVRFVATPWRNGAELLQLRKDLYARGEHGTEDRRERAVNKIFAWRSRKQDLPLLLDSTADVIDVILQDEKNDLPHNSLRLLYATAISRFITGLSDTQIDLSRDRPSWFPPGKSLQFPTSLLETRHCIVHRHLPSLFELKGAAKQVLDWLWEWYWSHLDFAFAGDGQARDVSSKAEIRERCQSILKTYVKERKSEIKSKRKADKAAAKALSSYDFLTASASTKQNVVVDLLVSEKAILPTHKKLGSSMSGAFLIWTPFLLSLCTTTPTFLHMLLGRITDVMNKMGDGAPHTESDPVREGMYEWLVHIFSSSEWSATRRRGRSSNKNGSGAEKRLLDSILGQCFTSPTFWNLKLADALLKDEDALNRGQWLAILEVAKSEGGMEVDGQAIVQPSNEEDMEVDSIKETLPIGSGRKSRGEEAVKMSGPQKTIGLWKPTPIGALPDEWEDDE